jgi:hypothetical protein
MLFVFVDQFAGGVADCEAASDAVVLEVDALPQVGVATPIAGQASASMTPASTSVAVLGQAVPAEPPSLPEWASHEDCFPIACEVHIELASGLRRDVTECAAEPLLVTLTVAPATP